MISINTLKKAMINKLFCGSVSYQINFSGYKPSINGEVIDIYQNDKQRGVDSKIQESELKVEIFNDQSLEFSFSLKTSFFESDLSVAKEWFTDYQEWIFTTFATQTGSIIEQSQKLIVSEVNPPESGMTASFFRSESACFVEMYSSSPLLQKVGNWSFLSSSQFIKIHPKIKTIYKQYSFCLQCKDPIARYMLLYNLLFQINEYQGRSNRQADIDDLIREVIQEAAYREEFINNQETQRANTPDKTETIYTCLRNEIAHTRQDRILVFDDGTTRASELTLDQTISSIRQYISSLSRIVQLAILNLSSQASLDSSE